MIDKSKIFLRKANISDALLTYKWAVNPKVRANSLNSNVFSFENHLQWFSNKLDSSETIYFILMERFPLGQIRFEKFEDGWLISFLIDELFHGKGLGKEIIKMGMKEMREGVFYAYVLEKNIPSIKIFESLEFESIKVEDEYKKMNLSIKKFMKINK